MPLTAHDSQLELWGGVEYTCNRVGDMYFDQMKLSGHSRRVSDIELFSELGLRTLRCGMLWEHHAFDPSWRCEDARMDAIRRAGIRPIAGLLHHGSGPSATSLADEAFPEKLARYAAEVATRYPWIDAYTPVNEPNTTARFSSLYGVWFPHQRSRAEYLHALLRQMKATVLSMRAVRRINSQASLIQTDDLGRITSTPELSATADLLNQRRWLSFDLLCGTVDLAHPLYAYLLNAGIRERDLLWFQENPCPPQIVGVNYYVTSDRFLDHRRELYPPESGSIEGAFVDVETVRVHPEGITGFEPVLAEAASRLGLPVAITEVHLGDSAPEQIRWVAEAWRDARRARHGGVPCIAVTLWALLGSFFWNSLVTAENGHYEPGVFTVRNGRPELTELGCFVRELARTGELPKHAALAEPGWWRCPSRICFAPAEEIAA